MKQKELLIISLTIFITICGWIVAEIYHINTRKNDTYEINQVLIEVNKIKIDTSIFPELLLRK